MKPRMLLVALVAIGVWLAIAGSATAAFPDFSGCPTSAPSFQGCIDVQNTTGNLNIKGFNVPLGASLEIRGALADDGRGGPLFVPPAGTNGFFTQPVAVPGGLLGIEWIPGTSVLAITELAGPASAIVFDLTNFSITMPVKVRLVNTLLGMNCHIGTDSSPVVLNLIIGTTNPPPPNRPISGSPGSGGPIAADTLVINNNHHVDNAFAVPSASRCGFGLGLINALVDAKLRLPSAAGNNAIDITDNVGIRIGA